MKPVIIIAIAFVLLIPVSIDVVFGQSYTGVLTLNSIPSSVKTGDTITFSGTLKTTDGRTVSDALIYIKDDVTFDTDTVIGTVTTDNNGRFSATWNAIPRSSGSYDFYAIYEGGGSVSKSRSMTYTVMVSSSSSSTSGSSSSPSIYLPTIITLDRVPTSIYAGQTVTFTGKLTSSGSPVSNAVVAIMEDDPLIPDEILATGRTDSNGKFSISWNVVGGLVEQDYDIYSTFNGDSKYSYARSNNQEMSVLRYGGSITLDKIPSSVEVGDSVQFSGTLQLNQGSSKGAVVYIKDEDLFNPDDLLATAYVDSSGKFSANWFVNYVDVDDVADIYAVFEGNDILARLTTCDPGSTMPISIGGCLNTIPMRIITPNELPPPLPPTGTGPSTDTTLSGNEYMKLYYSFDLNRNPKVAIVPSPDSYDEAKIYISSIQEGIKMWESALESKFGGTWNVTFEIIKPGTLFFTTQPDIVMNIVTADEDIKCLSEYSGWTKLWRGVARPIQTQVCTTSPDIGATAAHEFIHAMGLGHVFNKKGDLMCSSELVGGRWVPTCPFSFFRSNQPSDFNLAATVHLYNLDGFKNPNRNVSYDSKFTYSDYLGGSSSSITPIPITPPTTPTVTIPPTIPTTNSNCFSQYLSEQYNQAISCYNSYLKSNPSDISAMGFLGRSYEKTSDFNSALSIFQKINRLEPNNTNGLSGIARIYLDIGECDKAINYYEKVVAIEPDHIEAKIFLSLKNIVCSTVNDSPSPTPIPSVPIPTQSNTEKISPRIDFALIGLDKSMAITEGVELEGRLYYLASGIVKPIAYETIQLKTHDRFSVIQSLKTDYNGNFKWEASRNHDNYDDKSGKSSWSLYLYYDGNKKYNLYTAAIGDVIIQNPNIINKLATEIQEKIPDWVKNNAKWWATGSITDRDYAKGIQHLINENIILLPNISPAEKSSVGVGKIPSWVKYNSEWWADGLIDEKSFVTSIQYLVNQGIIEVR